MLDADVLAAGAVPHSGDTSGWVFVLFGVLALTVGLLNTTMPRQSLRMSRWQYRNARNLEPSDAAVAVLRTTGVLVIILGVIMLVVGLNK